MDKVLVTGASGFIGRALTAALAADGHCVRAAARTPFDVPAGAELAALPDLAGPVDWTPLLDGVGVVLHLAGVAHARRGAPEALYDRINRDATAALAEAAAGRVRRFIFVSSIRAQTGPAADHVLTESDPPRPTDAYGRSKLAAEEAVRASGASFTILRPVIVYGPGVKGNLAQLARLAAMPLPLPFGGVAGRRSLLGMSNLTSAVRHVIAAPSAAGETYIVADPAPLSLPEIVTALRSADGRGPGLWTVPPAPLLLVLRVLGRSDLWDRLGGSLVADPGKLMAAGWRPCADTKAGLAAMATAARREAAPRPRRSPKLG